MTSPSLLLGLPVGVQMGILSPARRGNVLCPLQGNIRPPLVFVCLWELGFQSRSCHETVRLRSLPGRHTAAPVQALASRVRVRQVTKLSLTLEGAPPKNTRPDDRKKPPGRQ